MDVKIDPEGMQALVAKAIFDGMTPDKRESLIQGAIKSLLETPKGNDRNYYGTKVSPLQEAFNRGDCILCKNVIFQWISAQLARRILKTCLLLGLSIWLRNGQNRAAQPEAAIISRTSYLQNLSSTRVRVLRTAMISQQCGI